MATQPPFLSQLLERHRSIPATWLLVAAIAGTFIAAVATGAGWWHGSNAVQLAWGANFGPATQDGEWWRLLAAVFLHFGALHLGFNAVALVEAGRYVERMLGPRNFLAVFLIAGIAGNLVSLATQGGGAVSGGASGAIFGLLGALLAGLWFERSRLDPGEFRWLFRGAGVFVAASVGLGFAVPGIDNAAHLGGLGFGTLAALSLQSQAGDRFRRRIGHVAAIALAGGIAGLALAIPEPAYDWSDELALRTEIAAFVGRDAALATRWEELLGQRYPQDGRSFAELAARIETDVGHPYSNSFHQLSSLHFDPRAPSAATLSALRRYAAIRGEAARDLADALRLHDPTGVDRALSKARHAGQIVLRNKP
jgi:rhomboid protease GluP